MFPVIELPAEVNEPASDYLPNIVVLEDLCLLCNAIKFTLNPYRAIIIIHSRCIFPRAATQSVTGYTLEFPDKRSLEPSAERNTPPVCICILRAVLHCLLIWTCCNQKVKFWRINFIVDIVY